MIYELTPIFKDITINAGSSYFFEEPSIQCELYKESDPYFFANINYTSGNEPYILTLSTTNVSIELLPNKYIIRNSSSNTLEIFNNTLVSITFRLKKCQ